MRYITHTTVCTVLALGLAGATAYAQAPQKTVTKTTKEAVKQAGHSTEDAMKKAGEATSKAAKKTAHKTGKAARTAAGEMKKVK